MPKRILAAVLCAAALTSGLPASATADTQREIRDRQWRSILDYSGGGRRWSVPYYIVACESGGNYRALNRSSGAGGAYQIMPATWRAYGGRGGHGHPNLAHPHEQDRVAHRIWNDVGASAWSCG